MLYVMVAFLALRCSEEGFEGTACLTFKEVSLRSTRDAATTAEKSCPAHEVAFLYGIYAEILYILRHIMI